MGIRAVNSATEIGTIRLQVPEDIASGPGSWVEVVSKFRVADRQEINKAVVMAIKDVRQQGGGTESETEVKTSTMQGATLVQAVKAWGGPIFCRVDHARVEDHDEAADTCRPLNVTERNILDLDDNIGSWLVLEVNKRNPLPSTEREGRSNTG